MLELQKLLRVTYEVACSNIFILFYKQSWQGEVLKKWWFLSVFSRLGPFPQDFGQVKVLLMFELYKRIRVSHAVVCLIVFLLFFEWGWQGGTFTFMKNNHFLVFFSRLGLFSKFLGRLRSYIIHDLY